MILARCPRLMYQRAVVSSICAFSKTISESFRPALLKESSLPISAKPEELFGILWHSRNIRAVWMSLSCIWLIFQSDSLNAI